MSSLGMRHVARVRLLLTSFCCFVQMGATAELFPLSIVHINDFHARYEPSDKYGGACFSSLGNSDPCIGGYARTVFTVKKLLADLRDTNPVYLNAGDSFQGTLWYSIGKWKVTSEFLNLLPAEAMTLGNHEFDDGVAGLLPFLQSINTSMLVANMDVRRKPSLEGLFQRSKMIERSGRKIGLIGVLLQISVNFSVTDNVTLKDETAAIRTEVEVLRSQGANIILMISHCGYDVDKKIAKSLGADIDVIVGAHSHTFLYTGEDVPGPDNPEGDYPTIVETGAHRTLIVQAGAYAKYVGNLTVYFDEAGEVVDFSGAPIYMSANVPEDQEVLDHMKTWKSRIDDGVVGITKVDLEHENCRRQECNLGNFYCDAMVFGFANSSLYVGKNWTSPAICMINSGALRVPIKKGYITRSHLYTMSPHENDIVVFRLSGAKFKETLECSVSHISNSTITDSNYFLQLSGVRVTFDYTRPVGDRVVALKVRCGGCENHIYEDVDEEQYYRIISSAYLTEGGYDLSSDYRTQEPAMKDLDNLVKFTKYSSPIDIGLEGRISILTV